MTVIVSHVRLCDMMASAESCCVYHECVGVVLSENEQKLKVVLSCVTSNNVHSPAHR